MSLFGHLFIYNLAASILIYGSLAHNPRLWLHRMPPEVRSKVPEKTPAERKLFIGVALPFLLLLFVYPIVYVIKTGSNLWTDLWILMAFFAGFAVWDTLVLDLLIKEGIQIYIYDTRKGHKKDFIGHYPIGVIETINPSDNYELVILTGTKLPN